MEYYKLVRDKVPEFILEDGKVPIVRVLSDENEFMEALCHKLVEETAEFVAANKYNEVRELCDVYTVLKELATRKGLTMQDVAELAQLKNETHGTYNGRYKLLSVESGQEDGSETTLHRMNLK